MNKINYFNVSFSKIFLNCFIFLAIFIGLLRTLNFQINGFFILEVFYFLSCCFILLFKKLKWNYNLLVFIVFIVFYFVISVFIAYINDPGVNYYDFLLIYKFFIYLILMSFWVGKDVFCKKDLIDFQKKIIFIFLFFYFLQKVVLGVNRPQVFGENNFELVLLLILFYISNAYKNNSNFLYIFSMGLVVLLSASRSAAIMYLVSVFFILLSNKVGFKTIFVLIFSILSVFLAVGLFIQRLDGGDLSSIDRINMFNELAYITNGWGYINWFFGAPRISPLPQEVCNSLSFYESLFSYKQDGTCYSVILHAFNMRVIYDHGLFVVLFIFLYLLRILHDLDKKTKILIFLIIVLTGFSVSSLNSVFLAISLSILCSLKRKE
ncbi:hypothetical protein D9K79_06495 [Acinetobacter cumulans]|uniref:O-antigen ligase domain-containing protein n=1 Tax=Acinetobacter cumulans TaxID=2136182 RepID=A0ABX9U777_9GAMM|nr:hypothetical protein [Acinetobacter cumulans]RLL47436.1 hypothetical protein D9K79_06495 [Acinetobacter cumulans]